MEVQLGDLAGWAAAVGTVVAVLIAYRGLKAQLQEIAERNRDNVRLEAENAPRGVLVVVRNLGQNPVFVDHVGVRTGEGETERHTRLPRGPNDGPQLPHGLVAHAVGKWILEYIRLGKEVLQAARRDEASGTWKAYVEMGTGERFYVALPPASDPKSDRFREGTEGNR